MNRVTRITGIVALGLAMLTAAPVMAQSQSGQAQQAPSATQSTQHFSKTQLKKFVNASDSIRRIQKSAKQKMQQADGRKAKSQIRKKVRQDMISAIKDSGLTLKQYNQIARAARSNPQLAQKIQQLR